jgi:hypothetical protein
MAAANNIVHRPGRKSLLVALMMAFLEKLASTN